MTLLTPQTALGETIHHLVNDILDLAGKYHASPAVTQFFYDGECVAEHVRVEFDEEGCHLTSSLHIWIPNGPTIEFSEEELFVFQLL